MRPTLFEIGDFKFHAYVTLLSVAFLFAAFRAVDKLNRLDPPIAATTRGGLWAFVGGLLGAKIFWIIQYDSIVNVWRAVIIWQGGMVFYGGLIGGVLGAIAYLRLYHLPVIRTADIAVPYIALAEGIGRIGCFLNGCCWGAVTTVPWAVYFPKGSNPYRHHIKTGLLEQGAPSALPVHPTQLYMFLGLMALFFLLTLFYKRRPFNGAVILAYLFGHGFVRFIVELFRGDSARSIIGLTVSQVISLGMIVAAIVGFAVFIGKTQQNKPDLEQEPVPDTGAPGGDGATV